MNEWAIADRMIKNDHRLNNQSHLDTEFGKFGTLCARLDKCPMEMKVEIREDDWIRWQHDAGGHSHKMPVLVECFYVAV